ncbi:MAG: hypothetical protein IAF02_11245 [Anaerolineae bacterium]|nr:hypothetical protein [Anaerolineae bacterium]
MSENSQTTKVFQNKKIIYVPEDLFPLSGSITVPVVLTPTQFDAYWKLVQANDDKNKLHGVLDVYATRLPLITENNLRFMDTPIKLPENPLELVDQAIAPFVVAATQNCIDRATRLPTLPKLSANGTKA